MNRILIAAFATIAFAGIANAEGSPALYGNYSANVLQDYNRNTDASTDRMSTASVANMQSSADTSSTETLDQAMNRGR